MTNPIKTALAQRGVAFEEHPNGDIFFRRSHDGHGMFVRSHSDGTYDWSVGAGSKDPLMNYREPERHDAAAALKRIDDFLGLVVSGPLVLDTLALVRRSMELGMGRRGAEDVARVARDFAVQMHEAGMDAHEIRTRFGEIHEQLRRQRLGDAGQTVPAE